MPADDADDRETFSSPACSMHEFEDELLRPSDARPPERTLLLRVSLRGLAAVAAFFRSIPIVKRFRPSAKA